MMPIDLPLGALDSHTQGAPPKAKHTPSIAKDPTRIRAALVPPFWARMQKYHRGRWYHDAAGGLCRLNLDLLHWLSALEEVRLVSEPWRERFRNV